LWDNKVFNGVLQSNWVGITYAPLVLPVQHCWCWLITVIVPPKDCTQIFLNAATRMVLRIVFKQTGERVREEEATDEEAAGTENVLAETVANRAEREAAPVTEGELDIAFDSELDVDIVFDPELVTELLLDPEFDPELEEVNEEVRLFVRELLPELLGLVVGVIPKNI